MNKTVISHFYNEEYLLPWWLKHHKKIFDHGILIDYNSTDSSVEVIKEICPTWEIVKTRNEYFSASDVDSEVVDIEKFTSGWKIALNTTEFLYGNFNILNSEEYDNFYIPCLYFVDEEEYRYSIDKNVPLHEQLNYGMGTEETNFFRGCRLLHKNFCEYPLGRHFRNVIPTEEFIIFNYGFSPMTEEMYKRKLQIQEKIPYEDKVNGLGAEHTAGLSGLNKEKLIEQYKQHLKKSKNLTEIMERFV